MPESRVLVVDNDESRAQAIGACLQFIDYNPVLIDRVQDLSLAEHRPQDWLAVMVGGVADWSGLDGFVQWLKRDRLHPPLLVLPPNHEKTVSAFELDRSACLPVDYPVKYAQLNELLRRAGLVRMEQQAATVRVAGPSGTSVAIRRVKRLIEQVAPHDTTVLITGESGTGKEVVARAVHENSARRDKPFVAVNCGAIPADLLESELFGHEKGAFTGAITTRRGRFEMADGGTLFLDEIGDMSLPMQVKILRALQERTYERVGSNRSQRCDVRIIAATHRNLEQNIIKGSFREDLFYRLNVFPIEMPPLRERLDDLPLLIQDLIHHLDRNGHGNVALSSDAVQVLRTYHWPGNVRELANLIERLAVLHPHATVQTADLPTRYRPGIAAVAAAATTSTLSGDTPAGPLPSTAVPRPASPPVPAMQSAQALPGAQSTMPLRGLEGAETVLPPDGVNLKDHIENIELALIKQALAQSNGVVAHAAKLLNTRRTTLVEKLRKYGLTRELGADAETGASETQSP
ncbi:sigma-54 dependent transcriptional regulator [Panacagrimonas sp.]|uniref:sigma-54 dependent transcriptional regulator n=1 Tax=Panacagrimonas sp. TaxID=2480088 RepID=UPI003B51A823